MKLWRYGQPIEILGDRYRLEGMLGSGGMADVCLGYDEYEQRQVAIKVLKADAVADREMLNRFVKEAAQVVNFQHPHILHVYDQTQVELISNTTEGKDSFLFYIVMEYAAGGDLQKRMTPGEPYYSLSAAFTIFRQICSAVQYAHKQGIIHRDIKPLNILFRRPRTGPEEAVLSDFGLAVQVDASHHTFAEAGSFSYMAPEQFRGQSEPASDIFALGVTLYHLLTGGLPFHREMQDFTQIFAGEEPDPLPLSQLNTTLPPILDDIIIQALDPDPRYRYRSAAEFWNAIVGALEATTLSSEQQPRQPQGRANPLPPPQPLVSRASRQEVSNQRDNEGYDEAGKTNNAKNVARPIQPLVLRPTNTERRAPATRTERQLSSGQTTIPRSAPYPRRQAQAPNLPQWRSRRILIPGISIAGFLLLLAIVLAVIVPFFTTSTITLIPQSRNEQHTFSISANQIQAKQLSATAPPQQNTVNASGTLSARQATGKLTFINQSAVDVVIQTTIITSTSGVAITFTGPITVTAVNPTFVTVTGHAVNAGPGGNIPAFDIDQHCCAPNNEIVVKNDVFTGGRNATQNDQVQQSDIDAAAQSLVATQTQQEQNSLKAQLATTEQVVNGSNQCKPTINPDHPVGSQSTTVTVNVSVTCTEEAYNTATAQNTGTTLLTAQSTQSLGAAYQLVGNVVTNITENNGQMLLKAQGTWDYAFSATRLSQLASLVAGKSPVAARAFLLSQPGVADVQISTTNTLPSANHIQIKVQTL